MKIALIGYGKMGMAIEEIALGKNHTCPLKINIDNLQDFTIENLQQCDVAVEFTGPETAENNIRKIIEAGIPVVSGSTGWLANKQAVDNYCIEKNGCFLYASNFSIGVNIFFAANKHLANLMNNHKNYDVSLAEIHHTAKLDSPSGTAITLAEQVIENIDKKEKWVNNKTDQENELEILSIRENPAPGTHSVKYSSDIDDIEIIHTAHNRKGFAGGVVLGAEFVFGKNGIFTMSDVLGIS